MAIVIKKASGGIAVMRLLNNGDIETCIAQWKAVNPGEYVSHREIPDAAIPTDRTFRNAWADTTPAQVVDIDLAKAKAAKIASFNEPFELAAAQMKAGYPPSEIDSWPIQEKEALAWSADPATPTPYIDSLAAARNIPRDLYLQKTVSKVNAFRAASSAIIGKRQRLEDAVKAATTLDQIRAINW